MHKKSPGSPASVRIAQQLPEQRYLLLLNVRIALGRRLIDQLCHQVLDVVKMYEETVALDETLATWPEYEEDYPRLVLTAEDARFHIPALTLPKDDNERPCLLCRRAAASLQADVVLPPQQAAA